MTGRARLGKARKRARHGAKQARLLLKKHGHKIDPAHRAEVQAALDQLEQATAGSDVAAVYDGLKTLDERVDERLGHLRKSPTREYVESIGVAVLIALLLRAFIVEAFTIPSGSMIPTLAVGDFLFVNKLSYGVRLPFVNEMAWQWDEPERGDVVVFVYPCDPSLDYIKRVVGLPGDTVYVDPNGFAFVNGELAAEASQGRFEDYDAFRGSEPSTNNCGPFLDKFAARLDGTAFEALHCGGAEPMSPRLSDVRTWEPLSQYRNCSPDPPQMRRPWKVPEGHVFVMGDNRRNSQDSRFWGFVPFGSIKGKAMFIWLSWDGGPPLSRPWEKIRWGRLFQGIHHST